MLLLAEGLIFTSYNIIKQLSKSGKKELKSSSCTAIIFINSQKRILPNNCFIAKTLASIEESLLRLKCHPEPKSHVELFLLMQNSKKKTAVNRFLRRMK
jgi:hypothetical protein